MFPSSRYLPELSILLNEIMNILALQGVSAGTTSCKEFRGILWAPLWLWCNHNTICKLLLSNNCPWSSGGADLNYFPMKHGNHTTSSFFITIKNVHASIEFPWGSCYFVSKCSYHLHQTNQITTNDLSKPFVYLQLPNKHALQELLHVEEESHWH